MAIQWHAHEVQESRLNRSIGQDFAAAGDECAKYGSAAGIFFGRQGNWLLIEVREGISENLGSFNGSGL